MGAHRNVGAFAGGARRRLRSASSDINDIFIATGYTGCATDPRQFISVPSGGAIPNTFTGVNGVTWDAGNTPFHKFFDAGGAPYIRGDGETSRLFGGTITGPTVTLLVAAELDTVQLLINGLIGVVSDNGRAYIAAWGNNDGTYDLIGGAGDRKADNGLEVLGAWAKAPVAAMLQMDGTTVKMFEGASAAEVFSGPYTGSPNTVLQVVVNALNYNNGVFNQADVPIYWAGYLNGLLNQTQREFYMPLLAGLRGGDAARLEPEITTVDISPATPSGEFVIGQAITATVNSLWLEEAVNAPTYEWRVSGAAIPAADGTTHTFTNENDGDSATFYVSLLMNDGTVVEYESEPFQVILQTPDLQGSLAAVDITVGSGDVTRNAGALLQNGVPGTWEVSVNGSYNPSVAVISSSGVVTIQDSVAIEGATVRATISNSGGSDWVEFSLDVSAAPSAPNRIMRFTGQQHLTAPHGLTLSPFGADGVGMCLMSFVYVPVGYTPTGGGIFGIFDPTNPGGERFVLEDTGNIYTRTPSFGGTSHSPGALVAGQFNLFAGMVWAEPGVGDSIGGWLNDTATSAAMSQSHYNDVSQYWIGENSNGSAISLDVCGLFFLFGTKSEMDGLIAWIRAQPGGFADPRNYPSMGTGTLSMKKALICVQADDGTTTVELTDPAIDGGALTWSNQGSALPQWTARLAPYAPQGFSGGGGGPPPVTAPENTALPVVSGNGQTGSVHTCGTGTWTGSPTGYSYQWKLNGNNVGSNSNSYTPQSTGTLTCTVTASNAGGSNSATSGGRTISVPGTQKQAVAFGQGGFETPKPSNWTSWSTVGRGFISYDYRPGGAPIDHPLMTVFDPTNISGEYLNLNMNEFRVRNSGGGSRAASAGLMPSDRWSLNAGLVVGNDVCHWLNDQFAEDDNSPGNKDLSQFTKLRLGSSLGGTNPEFAAVRSAGKWAVSGSKADMKALISWIRSQPYGFADPATWPGLAASSLTIDVAAPLVQTADGTTLVEADDPALGPKVWTILGTGPQWVNSTIPTLENTSGGSAPTYPMTSDTLDMDGGSLYGGLTVRFASPVLMGKFVTGEFWAVATGVPITAFEPDSFVDTDPPQFGSKPNRVRHGLVVDPWPAHNSGFDVNGLRANQGFDSDMGTSEYDADMNIDPAVHNNGPFTIPAPGAVLLKCISRLADRASTQSSPMNYIRTLTILSSQPAANSFRPPVKGWDGVTMYDESMVDWGKLASVPALSGPLGDEIHQPFPAWWSGGRSQQLKTLSPTMQWNGYYQYDGLRVGEALRFVNSGAPLGGLYDAQKVSRKAVAISLIQMGIDCEKIPRHVPSGSYIQGPLPAVGFAAFMLGEPAGFEADFSESWPTDKASIDQLQRRYNYTDPSVTGLPGAPDPDESEGVTRHPSRAEHAYFPEWIAVKSGNAPDYIPKPAMNRNQKYRQINADAWFDSGLAFYFTRKNPAAPHHPVNNRCIWDVIGREPARDYFERLMGWNEQIALGHVTTSHPQFLGHYPAEYGMWDEFRDYVLPNFSVPTNWRNAANTPKLPENPLAPDLAIAGRTITVTPSAFRPLNYGFPHSDANFLNARMRYCFTPVVNGDYTIPGLKAAVEAKGWTTVNNLKSSVTSGTGKPSFTVPAGEHWYAVQYAHQSPHGWGAYGYNEPIYEGDVDYPPVFLAAGVLPTGGTTGCPTPDWGAPTVSAGAVTSLVVPFPSGSAGTPLTLAVSSTGAAEPNTPSGWTIVRSKYHGSSRDKRGWFKVWVKNAGSGETSVTVTLPAAARVVARAGRANGSTAPVSRIAVGGFESGNGTLARVRCVDDPHAERPNVFVNFMSAADDDAHVVAWPTGYTALASTVSGGGEDNGCTLSGATYRQRASFADPANGGYTLAQSEDWATVTLIIPDA